MELPDDLSVLAATLKQRRQRLAAQFSLPVLLWSGNATARNFAANTYPFRASSHFLYFAGLPLENAVIALEAGKLELFMDDPDPADSLWHGPQPGRDELATRIGADAAFPLAKLETRAVGAATLPAPDAKARQHQMQILAESAPPDLAGRHRQLAQAIAQLRRNHDALALEEMRRAARVTAQAHQAGMAATPAAATEAGVKAAMEAVLTAAGLTCAYSSIVTVQGEVLHNHHYHHPLQLGDLLLADVGGETPLGWAADVTRTWPVSGKFSSTQRAIYDLVLAAHDVCIASVQPGVEYAQIHLQAAEVLATGLVDLGILKGNPQTLVERDAHALFFPHGVGHLLGLDVHDMEDLGDIAGYAPGRQRSDRFGLCYLRLNRPLEAGMVVTIEPGFYQVPAILHDPKRREQYHDCVQWERLAQFADVRGIRIEDDVLVTATGSEVLSAALPTQAGVIEEQVAALS